MTWPMAAMALIAVVMTALWLICRIRIWYWTRQIQIETERRRHAAEVEA